MRDPRPNGIQAALRSTLVLAVLAGALPLGGCQTPAPQPPPPPPTFPDDYAVVDLTRPLDTDTPFLPHQGGFRFEWIALEGDSAGRLVGAWSILDTMGTHVETPAVFGGEGSGVGGLLPGSLVAPLRVLDPPPLLRARDEDGTPLPTSVGLPRVLAHEAIHGRIPRGAAVLLRTGLGETASRDLGMAGTRPADVPLHAGWSPEAIRFLAVERGARLVGTDALVIDASGAGPDSPAARAAAESGVVTLNALMNLSSLPNGRGVLIVGVLPVQGARSAPARVMALVPPAPPAPVLRPTEKPSEEPSEER